MSGHTLVIDVGKSVAKASLWTTDGQPVARISRPNSRVCGPDYWMLDAAGIEAWLRQALPQFAAHGPITRIIPVGHGAAFALIRDNAVVCPPMDYEQSIAPDVRASYELERDAFSETGSPALPDGLNLGAQLFWLESRFPDALTRGTLLLTWPQYWAWRLSGVAATELTSLGCHTDLWCPQRREPSGMAQRRGWARLLAPLRRAADALGPVSTRWSAQAQLPRTAQVHCGLHDSNAALVASRGYAQFAQRDLTVLSTGTWFIAMRSDGYASLPVTLPADRDCLFNVDIHGQPVPSARFMGGREIVMLLGSDSPPLDSPQFQTAMMAAVPQVLARQHYIWPTQVPGCGPYPDAKGSWNRKPDSPIERAAAVALYAALMTDASLELIGARGHLLIEGRFAHAQVFVSALAALRPDLAVYAAHDEVDVAFGALRTLDPTLQPAGQLQRVKPLTEDLRALRTLWRGAAQHTPHTWRQETP